MVKLSQVPRGDLQDCAGSQQLCVGQDGGVEANIHGLKAIFEEEETHGVIQVDARNAFNTINRKVLLKNIGIICPGISVYASNCYAKPARLFVAEGVEIPSAEGTTLGNPIAMPIYALGILPLMSTLDSISQGSIKQTEFADDLTGCWVSGISKAMVGWHICDRPPSWILSRANKILAYRETSTSRNGQCCLCRYRY